MLPLTESACSILPDLGECSVPQEVPISFENGIRATEFHNAGALVERPLSNVSPSPVVQSEADESW